MTSDARAKKTASFFIAVDETLKSFTRKKD